MNIFRIHLSALILILALAHSAAPAAGVVDFLALTIKNARDARTFSVDNYGSTVTDTTRSLSVGITCKPLAPAKTRYYLDIAFLNKSTTGRKSFTSLTTYELPNHWGRFLVSSENTHRQEKLASTVTQHEVWWVYKDNTSERRPEEDYLSVDYDVHSSGEKPWGWVARLRDGTDTIKMVSSLHEAQLFFEAQIDFVNAYVSKRVPVKEIHWIPLSR